MIKQVLQIATLLAAVSASGQTFEATANKPIPQFVLTTIDGKKITNASLKGKIVIFDFWATWCGPCKMASPMMQKLYTDFKDKGVVVIGADTFENSPGPSGAKAYKLAHKFGYTFTYNNDGLAKSLGITGIPAFALVDKKGIIRTATVGIPGGGPGQIYDFFAKKIKSLP